MSGRGRAFARRVNLLRAWGHDDAAIAARLLCDWRKVAAVKRRGGPEARQGDKEESRPDADPVEHRAPVPSAEGGGMAERPPGKPGAGVWADPAMDAALRRLHGEGRLDHEIARALGVSKNAVTGRRWRLGLAGHRRSGAARSSERRAAPDAAPARRCECSPGGRATRDPRLGRGCQYIAAGDGPFSDADKCGRPVDREGGAWCARHRAVVYEAGTAADGAAIAAAARHFARLDRHAGVNAAGFGDGG